MVTVSVSSQGEKKHTPLWVFQRESLQKGWRSKRGWGRYCYPEVTTRRAIILALGNKRESSIIHNPQTLCFWGFWNTACMIRTLLPALQEASWLQWALHSWSQNREHSAAEAAGARKGKVPSILLLPVNLPLAELNMRPTGKSVWVMVFWIPVPCNTEEKVEGERSWEMTISIV